MEPVFVVTVWLAPKKEKKEKGGWKNRRKEERDNGKKHCPSQLYTNVDWNLQIWNTWHEVGLLINEEGKRT